jgi:hypothetical protein
MLAASYGVAMAKHVDLDNQIFVNETLADYARSIYNSMFSEEAVFSSTHLLTRDYGRRIIELASLYSPDLFSFEETQKSKPPYKNRVANNWGESALSDEKYHSKDSPFRGMDFENYTIGSLVPSRSNYDFKHEEYRKVKAQILWRIEQLGWSSEKFKKIENLIDNEHHWGRTEGNAKKTERYGKKYSWIAFFEMSGLLRDLEKISGENERDWNWDLDIDPSFPEQDSQPLLIEANFLGNPDMGLQDWIMNGSLPDVNPYLRLAEIPNEDGTWVMLDGYISQEDKKLERRIFCYIRSFIVLSNKIDSFLQHLSKQNLGNRWLPEKPSIHYTFAGEIPWCSIFSENEPSELSFVDKEETIKVERVQEVFFLDDKKLDLTEADIFSLSIFGADSLKNSKLQISKENLERIEVSEILVEVEEVQKYLSTYNALIPVCEFSLESERSTINNDARATVLAKELASDLELVGKPQTFDLFTNKGVKATYSFTNIKDDFNENSHSLLYLREELLKEFLEKNEYALIWVVWGERRSSQYIERAYKVFNSVQRYE